MYYNLYPSKKYLYILNRILFLKSSLFEYILVKNVKADRRINMKNKIQYLLMF